MSEMSLLQWFWMGAMFSSGMVTPGIVLILISEVLNS